MLRSKTLLLMERHGLDKKSPRFTRTLNRSTKIMHAIDSNIRERNAGRYTFFLIPLQDAGKNPGQETCPGSVRNVVR
jgi:hypothetical protein